MSLYSLTFLIPVLMIFSTACTKQDHQNSYDKIPVVNETYVHKYGVAVTPEFWNKSGEDGAIVSNLANGVVMSRSYTTGVLNGETNYTFSHNSQIEKREIYDQGKLVKSTTYYIDGTQKELIVYDDQSNMNTVSSWYINGTPRSVEQYINHTLANGEYYDANNRRDATVENYNGTRILRDDYGYMISNDQINQGQLSLSTTLHPNGAPKDRVPFENGHVSGTKTTFHPGGEPNTTEQWAQDQQHGTTVIYQHGEKLAEVPYINGVKQGLELRYRDGSEVVQKISWKNDQLHGPSTIYIDGVETTSWYYEGSPVSARDYHFLSDKPTTKLK